jgi:hypothetical protein
MRPCETVDTTRYDAVARSQRDWLSARGFLNRHRHELSLAAQHLYPASLRAAGTPLLAGPGWLPAGPVPLDQVALSWQAQSWQAQSWQTQSWQASSGSRAPVADGTGLDFAGVLPLREDGSRFGSYADALGVLSRPGIFEDRSCYRLLDARALPAGARLGFGPGRYFDLVNTCEAVAHEYAAAVLARGGTADGNTASDPVLDELPVRSLIGDPTDLRRRPVMVATCTLVLRADRDAGEAAMLLHWRDPARVASGGGLYQVAPVGVFQPSHDATWNQANDFDLWRSIARELSEELLGGDEDYHSDIAPIEYERWPLFAELARARAAGTLRVYWLGLGVDPLTLAADMLTVAVFDAALFDAVFSGLVSTNDEGHLVSSRADTAAVGVAFIEESIERFTAEEPMQAAGAALLRTAWAHREVLLG